ncbi:MAG: hypothetical protein IJ062_06675 [Firmicutes bacterium]|nr:hypothetical protein [Bacillota bacterium]
MKIIFGRICAVLAALAVLMLSAALSNGTISFKRGPDALTSATVKNKGTSATIAGVSGNFVIIINKEKNPKGTLEYFTGEGEKIKGLSCHIPKGDKKARILADKMTDNVTEGDAMLLISKAEYGDFDILIFSKKTADIYTAKSLYDKDFVDVAELKGE